MIQPGNTAEPDSKRGSPCMAARGHASLAIRNAELGRRLRGIVLLNAGFGEKVFTDWIARRPNGLRVSAYTNSTEGRNKDLKTMIGARDHDSNC